MMSNPFRQTSSGRAENRLWLYRQFLEKVQQQPVDTSSRIIGSSEAGEPIYGFVFGSGPVTASLMAGAHADEPVGPNTLYHLVLEMLRAPDEFNTLFSRFRFLVIPHVNPDGDAANAPWIIRWPELDPFLTGMKRERPGRDIEFGYPHLRKENRAATEFWESESPADVHFSLHGMQFSEGYLLLINDEWEPRTRSWRIRFGSKMRSEGLEPHDHDRGGEKGFNYMGPGFSSTPKGKAMSDFFLAKGDPETAAQFHASSMEYHMGRNENVLCMVTEFPLYLIRTSPQNGVPENYLKLKEEWARRSGRSRKDAGSGRPEKLLQQEWEPDSEDGPDLEMETARLKSQFDIRPLPLEKAMRLQWYTIQTALELAAK